MRKIIATEFYTIDGLMSDPDDKMDWVSENLTPDMGKAIDEVYKRIDTLFLGATTYKIMAAYWPTADTNPNAFEGDAEFASVINNLKKIVFAKTALEPEWANTEFRPSIDADEIRKMKNNPGKDMLIAGSASIVQQFTNLGLSRRVSFTGSSSHSWQRKAPISKYH
ncbi:MAG: hypothetical protein KatS3mg092_0555 [Patescibacteria group bacterium]|nr:MAG: hypothetical protein KatS3mg092_0555 [Patescibacteria group bacterium]